MAKSVRLGLAALLALLVPPLIMWIYIATVMGAMRTTERTDLTAIGTAVCVGLVGLNLVRMRLWLRIAVSALYAAVGICALFVFSLELVCGMYRSCL